MAEPLAVAVLGRTAMFGSLDAATLAELAALARPRALRTGQFICRKGEPSRSLYIIAHGRVKISTTSPDGREMVLNLLGEGEVFGEVALADGGPRTADAAACEPVRLLTLDRAELVPYLERRADVTLRMLAALAGRLRWVAASLEDSSFLALPARLAKRLVLLGRHFGVDTPGGRRLTVTLPQRELASHMGVSRESVNRLLQGWVQAGLIGIDRGVVVLRDIAGLEAIAESG
jgi:CRP-like cAMP-binding protein